MRPGREAIAMMTLPFFTAFAAFAAAWTGRRGAAVLLWAVSLALMLALFALHATDALDIDL